MRVKTSLNLLPAMLVILSLAILAACAVTSQRHFTSQSSYDKVFEAVQQSAIASGFGVTSANKSEGFISASQGVVMGNGTQAILSAQLTRGRSGTDVTASIVPPPATMGNVENMMRTFESEMRKRVPDVRVINAS